MAEVPPCVSPVVYGDTAPDSGVLPLNREMTYMMYGGTSCIGQKQESLFSYGQADCLSVIAQVNAIKLPDFES